MEGLRESGKCQIIPQTNFDLESLEGLRLFYGISERTLSDYRIKIPPEEMKFFDILSRYIDNRKISFEKLKEAKNELDKHLLDLNTFSVSKEEATNLKLKGKYEGRSIGLIYASQKGDISGDIGGRISSLHNIKLSPKYQSEYLSLLNMSIEEINEILARISKGDDMNIKSEMNTVINSINNYLMEEERIDIGIVNEINARLDNYSEELSKLQYLGDFENFESLSLKEKYERLSKPSISKMMFLNKKGVNGLLKDKIFMHKPNLRLRNVIDGSFKTRKKILKWSNLIGIPTSLYGGVTIHPAIGGLGLSVLLSFDTVMLVEMNEHKLKNPYSELKAKLDDSSVNQRVNSYIKGVMDN